VSLDVLAIGAHPDDADLGLGGTLIKLARSGARVGILDLTEGELSTRGTVEERRAEAREAAERLGLSLRRNAYLPDGGIQNDTHQRQTVVEILRALKPRMVLHHHPIDRHPDHETAHRLVRDAIFMAAVAKFPGGEPHRVEQVFLYHPYGDYDGPPAWVMDITGVLDDKLNALKAYRSQLYNPEFEGPATYVSSKAFWEGISTRAEYWVSASEPNTASPSTPPAPLVS
jgi:N-acetylglucosamine malate deacetylase 1